MWGVLKVIGLLLLATIVGIPPDVFLTLYCAYRFVKWLFAGPSAAADHWSYSQVDHWSYSQVDDWRYPQVDHWRYSQVDHWRYPRADDWRYPRAANPAPPVNPPPPREPRGLTGLQSS